jgi:hypothetical protein
MSLLVNNVVSSSSQISYSYLGTEEIFGYTLNLNYKIKVEDVRFDNNDGVLLSGRSAIRLAYKRQNITARIAGDEILNGLITSLSFSESSLTGEETVDITIEERRRLDSYSSSAFAKYIPSPHLLTEFKESYNFSRSGPNYSYSRTISVKYAQDIGGGFLHNAKTFLTNYYYENRPQIGYYEDGISENARFDKGFNGLLTENIDLINLSVELQENFESSFIIESENVSKNIKNSISLQPNGYLAKSISVDLTSLRNDSSNVLSAAIASTVTQENSQFGQPISIQKGITKDSNKASIQIDFSTDPRTSQNNVIEYSCSKQKSGAFLQYELTVKYKSRGKNITQRYDNVISIWESAKGNNESKVLGLFSEATNIYEKSRTADIRKNEGKISEKIIYITDDSYDVSGLTDGIIKYKINISKQDKTKRSAPVVDLVNLKQKLVTSRLDKLGSATVTATAISEPSYGRFFGKDFLATKTAEMNASLEETTYYATSDNFSIDLMNGTTTRVITYIIA